MDAPKSDANAGMLLKPQLTALRESCKQPQLFARTATEVSTSARHSWSIFKPCFIDSSESIQELLLETAKTWAQYQPATVVLALITFIIDNLAEIINIPAPNRLIRFVYTIFDELFARSVEEEDEMVFVVKSLTSHLLTSVGPQTVQVGVSLLRHLVRFSSIPKLRNMYNYMYDIRDFYCTEFLGRGQFAEVIKGFNKHSGQTVALKKMKFSTVSKGLQTALLREAAVMSKMANPSVVRLYDNLQEDHPHCYITLPSTKLQ